MKLVKSSFEIWDQGKGLEGIYKQIEKAGRVCYKSEDKITENSANNFVDRMIRSNHGAMLEHGTVYLTIDCSGRLLDIANKYVHNKYSKWTLHEDRKHYCITSNLRVLVENNWLDDLQYICEPTEFHEKRITVKFILSRSIAQEYTRHRVFSFAMESQRYCNYSKYKFGNETTFIIPCWATDIHSGNSYDIELINNYSLAETENLSPESVEFIRSLVYSEVSYFTLLKAGWKPQEAREVLPNACKTELVMTGFVSDWKHLFRLRTSFLAETGKPHPDMANLCDLLYKEFVNRELMESLI